MISTRWLEKRKPYWSKLEQFIGRSARGGPSSLSHHELQELGLLYRQTASDLAVVREDPTSRQAAFYLNQLLGRAHNLIYMGHRPRFNALLRFFTHTYPRIFRRALPQILLAVAVFLAAAIATCALTLRDPAFAHRVLGPQMMAKIEHRQMWTDSILAIKPMAASGIMTNNLTVTFSTFAMGITAGIGTLWMMIVNGMLIGVIGAATFQSGMALQLWSFVAPHGVLELPAIFIAGGAGLEIARGMLFPGFLPRRDSLAQSGALASQLLLGTIPMLIVAGIIEGFLSPSGIPAPLKFLFAGLLFAIFVSYLFSSPREESPRTSASNPTA